MGRCRIKTIALLLPCGGKEKGLGSGFLVKVSLGGVRGRWRISPVVRRGRTVFSRWRWEIGSPREGGCQSRIAGGKWKERGEETKKGEKRKREGFMEEGPRKG
ncbi:hypothetical protein IE53DRAFT_99120 [Violaceomyces palustris]|uniref:Uncharacterized protein n=1 Tax=Violaceomyces palustris TaxID=1673888 RepID=A0ACD0NWY1_9BASI|nr:hypothetical protein IE53DRAFT_99120 [Violaceomyces palustris]